MTNFAGDYEFGKEAYLRCQYAGGKAGGIGREAKYDFTSFGWTFNGEFVGEAESFTSQEKTQQLQVAQTTAIKRFDLNYVPKMVPEVIILAIKINERPPHVSLCQSDARKNLLHNQYDKQIAYKGDLSEILSGDVSISKRPIADLPAEWREYAANGEAEAVTIVYHEKDIPVPVKAVIFA